jgi:hypothetical protein
MRIAVVGSRKYGFPELVTSFVSFFRSEDILVSGGAWGVDSIAQKKAREMDLECRIFYPDWEREGKSAGFKRNKFIVDDSDYVVAFWDGVSRGTLSSMKMAMESKKPLTIYVDDEVRHRNGGELMMMLLQGGEGVC